MSRSKILFAAKTLLEGYTHKLTIICRQLLVSHVAAFQPMKRKRKMFLMIIYLIKFVVRVVNLIKQLYSLHVVFFFELQLIRLKTTLHYVNEFNIIAKQHEYTFHKMSSILGNSESLS